MTYKTLADVNATTDLSEILLYVNDITRGWAMPSVLFSFFVITLLAGSFAQMRFRGDFRFDFAFATAGFATFGLAVLMSIKTGLLNPIWLFTSLGVALAGVVWIYMSQD